MFLFANPVATRCMNACIMPAPAPCAKTKQARGLIDWLPAGSVRSAETVPTRSMSSLSSCVLSWVSSCVVAVKFVSLASSNPVALVARSVPLENTIHAYDWDNKRQQALARFWR